jgi:hypothetical protein
MGSHTKKSKTGESEVLTDPKYIQKLKERKASASERRKRNAKKITFKTARQENHGEDVVCRECKKAYKDGECWVQCLQCLHWYHVSCAENGNDPYFVCHYCLSDKSD